MEALTKSSSRFFADTCRNGAFSASRALFNKPQICFLRSQKFLNVTFSRSISLQHKPIQCSLDSSLPEDSQADLEIVEVQTEATHQPNTVHVKFQLQKECLFGQHFFLVGDDPIFGLWDPSKALPLDWSEGHIWIVELNIPVGKTFKFKFILKEATGEIVWQPNPDRSLETWETKNTIIISEDWENAEVQKITEEPTIISDKESMVNSNMELGVAENMTDQGDLANEESIIVQGITNLKDEGVVNVDNELILVENFAYLEEEFMDDANKELVVAEDGTSTKEELTDYSNMELIYAENISGNTVTGNNTIEIKDVENLDAYEEGPVLVHGLTPLPTMTNTEEEPQDDDSSIIAGTLVEAGEAKIDNAHELQVKEGTNGDSLFHEPNTNPHLEETTMDMFDDENREELHVNGLEENPHITKEQELPDSQPDHDDDNVSENDIVWGRKILHKLLMGLGFC